MEAKKPDIVGLSFSFYINIMKLVDVVKEIKQNFPDQKIILGGRAELNGQAEMLSRFEDVYYFDSIVGLDNLLKKESASS